MLQPVKEEPRGIHPHQQLHPQHSQQPHPQQQQQQQVSFFGRLFDLPKWVPTVDSRLATHERRLGNLEAMLGVGEGNTAATTTAASLTPAANNLQMPLKNQLLTTTTTTMTSPHYSSFGGSTLQQPILIRDEDDGRPGLGSTSSTTPSAARSNPSSSSSRPSRKRTRKYVPPPSTDELVMLTKPMPGFCPPDLQEAVLLAFNDPNAREMMRKNNRRFVIPPELIPARYSNGSKTSKHFLNICTGCGFTATSKYFVKKHRDLVPYCTTRHGAAPTDFQAILEDLSSTITRDPSSPPATASIPSPSSSSSDSSVSPLYTSAASFGATTTAISPSSFSNSSSSTPSPPPALPYRSTFEGTLDETILESFIDYSFLQDTQEFVKLVDESPSMSSTPVASPKTLIGSVVRLLRIEDGVLLATSVLKQSLEEDEAEEEKDDSTSSRLFAVIADPHRCSSDRSKLQRALQYGLLPVTSNGISRVRLVDNEVLGKETDTKGGSKRVESSNFSKLAQPAMVSVVSITEETTNRGRSLKRERFAAKLTRGSGGANKIYGHLGVALTEPELDPDTNTWSVEAFCIPDIFGANAEERLTTSLQEFRNEMMLNFEKLSLQSPPASTESEEKNELMLRVLQEQSISSLREHIEALAAEKRSRQLGVIHKGFHESLAKIEKLKDKLHKERDRTSELLASVVKQQKKKDKELASLRMQNQALRRQLDLLLSPSTLFDSVPPPSATTASELTHASAPYGLEPSAPGPDSSICELLPPPTTDITSSTQHTPYTVSAIRLDFCPSAGILYHDKKLYICDPDRDRVVVYDALTDSPMFEFQVPGGPYCICAQHGCKDRGIQAFIYIGCWKDNSIRVYRPNGSLLREFNERSWNTFVVRPYGIAADEARRLLFVADWNNHRVHVLGDEDGRVLRTLGTNRGSQPGELKAPIFVSTDSQGRVLCSEETNYRVQLFNNSDGKSLFALGKQASVAEIALCKNPTIRRGSNIGEFNRARGVAVDLRDNIYVCDTRNRRIQVFDKDGNVLQEAQFMEEEDAEAGLTENGPIPSASFSENVNGTLVGDLEPSYLSVADNIHFGWIYLADPANKRIQKFVPNNRSHFLIRPASTKHDGSM